MATVQTAIKMYDGMTGPLKSMYKVMDTVVTSFENMQAASSNSIDMSSLINARAELTKVGGQIEHIENRLNEVDNAQQQFNNSISSGRIAASGLESTFKRVAGTIAGALGIKGALDISDQLAGADARLSLIVDDGGSVEELQKKIFASAQASRGAYLDTIDTVAKLGLQAGDAFESNDQMIKFAELMNKNFVIAGASAQEQSSAMYQLTQAMSSGRLQGDEYRSIIENAPLLADSIEDYMTNVQGLEGTMKEWASEGLLTSEIITAALFNSADEIESRFEQMPMTWSQLWTQMKNEAILAFEPILTKMNELANSAKFQTMMSGIIDSLYVLASVALWAFESLVTAGSWVQENWSAIAPVLMGVVAALLIYNAVSGVTRAINMATAVAESAKAAATMMATGATFAQTAAQHGLNAALLASPVTWVVIGLIALIAIVYAVVAAINKWEGTSISATGVIMGAFAVAGAFIGNILIALWNTVVDVFVLIYNFIAAFANFFANVFNDPVGAIVRLFADMADAILGILESIAAAIDTLFGSNLADAVSGWRSSLAGLVEEKYGAGIEIMEKIDGESLKLDRLNYGDAYNAGYKFGEGIDEKVSGMFDSMIPENTYDPFTYDAMLTDVGSIAEDTGSMSDSLEITEEDLKYLRDIAEREAINRFTTAEIKVEQTNHNNISSGMDIDGFMDYWNNTFYETLEVAAEGVHP